MTLHSSESGYLKVDIGYYTLVEMGNFICEQTDLILSRVTNILGLVTSEIKMMKRRTQLNYWRFVGCVVIWR